MNQETWTDNVIIADADFVDKVAFDLTVNFERMLERRIPKADTARWAECVALDGGVRESPQADGPGTTVVLLHESGQTAMRNFQPGAFADELNGKAFNGRLGEFCFVTACGEDIVDTGELFVDTLNTVLQQKEVKRVVLVPDDRYVADVRMALRRSAGDQHITLLSMQPVAGGNFRQEMLGYSLMAALGIRGEELDRL